MEYISMSIGNVLKERRISLSIKQEDIAEQMGVTVQTVSKWERGVTEPKASQVHQLSLILKVSEKEICRGELITERSDPFEFVRKAGALISEVPQTELLVGMQDFIEDEEGFIRMLASISNFPYEVFQKANTEPEQRMLKQINDGAIKFDSEEDKQDAIESLNKAIYGL